MARRLPRVITVLAVSVTAFAVLLVAGAGAAAHRGHDQHECQGVRLLASNDYDVLRLALGLRCEPLLKLTAVR